MKKKVSMILVILMVLSVMVAGFTPALADGHVDDSENRLSGANRYETAYEIAKENFQTAETVILVRGDSEDNIPQVVDGLTASGLAGSKEAPILLTPKDASHPDTMKALEELQTQNIYIIGGTAAVSVTVENELIAEGYHVNRVREEGGDRYSTAAAVAMEIGAAVNNTAIITSGNDRNLVDSLVSGPLAHQGHPILLVDNARGTVPQATLDAIAQLGIENLLIVGGTAAVSVEIQNTLEAIDGVTVAQRFSGVEGAFEDTGRVGTSLHLAGFEPLASFDEAYLVNGVGYVDAVGASTLGGPIVYYQGYVTEELKDFFMTKPSVKAIGGTATIPSDIVEEVVAVVEEGNARDAFNTAAIQLIGTDLAVGGTVYGTITDYDQYSVVVELADEDLAGNADEIFTALMAVIEDLGVVEVTVEGETFVLADTTGSDILEAIGMEAALALKTLGLTLDATVDMDGYASFMEEFHFDFEESAEKARAAFNTAALELIGTELTVDGTVYGEILDYDEYHVNVGLADEDLVENADEIFTALMDAIEDLGVVEVTVEGETFVLADTTGSDILDAIGTEKALQLKSEGLTLDATVDMDGYASFMEEFHFDFEDMK